MLNQEFHATAEIVHKHGGSSEYNWSKMAQRTQYSKVENPKDFNS